MAKQNDDTVIWIILIAIIVIIQAYSQSTEIDQLKTDILSGEDPIYDEIYDKIYNEIYDMKVEENDSNAFELGYESGYADGIEDTLNPTPTPNTSDDKVGIEDLFSENKESAKQTVKTPTLTPNALEDLETDENFIYSWNYENYDGTDSPKEYMDFIYDGIINATYFIYDTQTQYLHFNPSCPHVTDIALTRYEVKNFYEAIIYKYPYCQECFQPLIDYYQENN